MKQIILRLLFLFKSIILLYAFVCIITTIGVIHIAILITYKTTYYTDCLKI